MMMRPKSVLFIVVIAVLAGLVGCRPKVSKIAQGITPVVANFYVLNLEINQVRRVVRDAAPSKADTLQASYQRLLAEAKSLAGEAQSDEELKKYPILKDAMSSCLANELAFLDAESRAIANYAAESRLGDQINGITQHSRGNTIKRQEVEAQVGALFAEQQRYHQQLVKLLPAVATSARRCREFLHIYNNELAASKIVNYFNEENIFDQLSWENAKPARAKPVTKAKHRTAVKPRSTKRK